MLVLSRKPGESIRLGDDITLHITAVKGSRVRIAIEAPKEVPIARTELELEKQDLPTLALKTA